MTIKRHEFRHDCQFIHYTRHKAYFCSDPFGEWSAQWGHRIQECPEDCKRYCPKLRDEDAPSAPGVHRHTSPPHRMARRWAT